MILDFEGRTNTKTLPSSVFAGPSRPSDWVERITSSDDVWASMWEYNHSYTTNQSWLIDIRFNNTGIGINRQTFDTHTIKFNDLTGPLNMPTFRLAKILETSERQSNWAVVRQKVARTSGPGIAPSKRFFKSPSNLDGRSTCESPSLFMVFLGCVFAGFCWLWQMKKNHPEKRHQYVEAVENDDSLLDCIHDPISLTDHVRFSTQKISKKTSLHPPQKKPMNFHFSKYFSPPKIHIPNNGTTTPLLNHFTCFSIFGGSVSKVVEIDKKHLTQITTRRSIGKTPSLPRSKMEEKDPTSSKLT